MRHRLLCACRSLLLSSLCCAFMISAVAAQGAVLVRLDPPSHSMVVGDRAEIAIRIENVENLYGAEVHVQFDPAVLQAVDADSAKDGVQMRPGDWLQKPFVAANKIDNATGVADFAFTLVNPAPALSGSGAIAVIPFRARANGQASVTVQKAIIADRTAQEIASQWANAQVTVAPVTSNKERDAQAAQQATPLLGVAGLAASITLVLAIVALSRRMRRPS